MLTKKVIVTSGLVLAIFWQFSALADEFESSAKIQTLTKEFIEKNVPLDADESLKIKFNQSDIPQRLTVCSQSIEINFPKDSSRDRVNAVELACNGTKAWHVFMPVSVQIYTKVLVVKRNVAAKDILTENDLDYAEYDRNSLYAGFFKNKNDVVGQVAAQTIAAGAVITKRNIQQPILIHRNQTVDLVARSNVVTVTMKGIAKSDGGLNDTVKVYNPTSKRMLDGVVTGSSKVEVLS